MGRILTAALLTLLLAGCGTVRPEPFSGVPGAYRLPMPDRCEWWIYTEESHVGEWALALACPGIDLLRLYPWPPVQPWDEEPSTAPQATPEPRQDAWQTTSLTLPAAE